MVSERVPTASVGSYAPLETLLVDPAYILNLSGRFRVHKIIVD
jgi:hypothetical protein